MTETLPAKRKAFCAACGGERNCDIRGSHRQTGGDENVDWVVDWHILQCCGCDSVFVQTVSTNSEDIYQRYDEAGEIEGVHEETLRYWPALSKRAMPDWMTSSGVDAENVRPLSTSLLEVYGALNSDLNILAGIGMRTSFDVASELLSVNPDLTFAKKLDALVEKGHIGQIDRDRLNVLVEAGSASAHRGWRPTVEDLDTMMAILEHFVHHAFVAPARSKKLDADASAMKKKVPQRKPATKP